VQIDSSAGSLVVTGWDRDQVEVSGTVGVGAGSAEPQLERNGERVVVRLHPSPGKGAASHLDVRMPRRHRLELSGLSLDVRVEGLSGGIDVSVVSGTVWVRGGVAGESRGVWSAAWRSQFNAIGATHATFTSGRGHVSPGSPRGGCAADGPGCVADRPGCVDDR